MSAERRRLRAGVEVEVWKENGGWWMSIGGVVTRVFDLALDLITEPIPGEEAGPKDPRGYASPQILDLGKILRDIETRPIPKEEAAPRRLRPDIQIREVAPGVGGYMIPEDWPWVEIDGESYPIHARLLDKLTEPIPEEPSGEVEEQAAHIRGQMDAAKSGLRDIDEAYRLGGVPYLVQALRVRAMEAAMRDKDNDRAMADILARVEALEKRMEQQRQEVTITLPPVQVPTPAPEQDAAGGDEPSGEELVEWLESVVTGKILNDPKWFRWSRPVMAAAAIRLIRAGQQDTRSTGAFREVSDGQ